mmetsp:Transcript_68851/g.180440  ORF Transcript_68851/g.180440 Transcript_68851/m.180440 type:complete len:226 (+) Transcript_68851:758-1435(+)
MLLLWSISCLATTVRRIFSRRSLQSSMNSVSMNLTFFVPFLFRISWSCALALWISTSSSYDARSRMSRLTKVSSCSAVQLSLGFCRFMALSSWAGLSSYGDPWRTLIMCSHQSLVLSMMRRIRSTPSKMSFSSFSFIARSVDAPAATSPSGRSKPPIWSFAVSGSAYSTKAMTVFPCLPPPTPPHSLMANFFTGVSFIRTIGSGFVTRKLSWSNPRAPSALSPQA